MSIDETIDQTIDARIDLNHIPRHLACVMDGNGRWAQQRGLTRTDGHKAGEQALLDTVFAAQELGIEWVTVYAFSTENWKRPLSEVRFLMRLNEDILFRRVRELNERNIRVRFLGRRDRPMPRRLVRQMESTEKQTGNNTGLTLTIAINYGGRAELVDAVRRIVEDGVPARKITEKLISRYLYDPEMPEPDLVVRTSGEYRTSNFLMWEAAYSELVFPEVLWPDFNQAHLLRAVSEFQARNRRFGGLNGGPVEPTADDEIDLEHLGLVLEADDGVDIDLTDGAQLDRHAVDQETAEAVSVGPWSKR